MLSRLMGRYEGGGGSKARYYWTSDEDDVPGRLVHEWRESDFEAAWAGDTPLPACLICRLHGLPFSVASH
jgi:hypothetical protein